MPFVPSKAANETRIPLTEAWLSDIPDIVTFPPTCNNPELKEKVVIDGAVIANVLVNFFAAAKESVVSTLNVNDTAPRT